MKSIKEEYWVQWSSTRKKKVGKPMPEAWSEPAWDCFVMFGPRGKGFLEFVQEGFNNTTTVLLRRDNQLESEKLRGRGPKGRKTGPKKIRCREQEQ